MWGVTTQVSEPNISTACITALKKKTDTQGVAPSLMRIRDILLQTFLAWAKFLTTAGQLLSVSDITRPRYFKEVTISRGRPYALKALAVTSLYSSAANCRLFRSAT